MNRKALIGLIITALLVGGTMYGLYRRGLIPGQDQQNSAETYSQTGILTDVTAQVYTFQFQRNTAKGPEVISATFFAHDALPVYRLEKSGEGYAEVKASAKDLRTYLSVVIYASEEIKPDQLIKPKKIHILSQ